MGNQKIKIQDLEYLIEQKINKRILTFPTRSIILVNLKDIEKSIVAGPQKQYILHIKPFTRFQKDLVGLGGIVNYYKKYGELKIEL